MVSRFNFDQLLISTIDTLKATAIEKCLRADQDLLEMYLELERFEDRNLSLSKHTVNLEDAIAQNQEWVSNLVDKKVDSYSSTVSGISSEINS